MTTSLTTKQVIDICQRLVTFANDLVTAISQVPTPAKTEQATNNAESHKETNP